MEVCVKILQANKLIDLAKNANSYHYMAMVFLRLMSHTFFCDEELGNSQHFIHDE